MQQQDILFKDKFSYLNSKTGIAYKRMISDTIANLKFDIFTMQKVDGPKIDTDVLMRNADEEAENIIEVESEIAQV